MVRICYLRRLVLPISYFVKTPFQNRARQSSAPLAYIELNLEYRLPIEPPRKEFQPIPEASPRWFTRCASCR